MKDKVIIFVSDDQYINHVKSVAVNCIRQGGYDGDFAVICPLGSRAADEFKSYGWHVLGVNATGFLQKFSILSDYFKQWDKALYVDCDILVQGKLSQLFSLLDNAGEWIFMDREDGDTMRTMPVHNRDEVGNATLYGVLKSSFPFVYERTFNTAFVLFNPAFIARGTIENLLQLQETFFALNDPAKGGTDQQIINLLLHPRGLQIPNKLVCYWGLDEPQNRVDSEFRGYKADDVPVAIHFGRHYAMWEPKNEGQAAYYSDRTGRVNKELYLENLRAFDEYFKRQ